MDDDAALLAEQVAYYRARAPEFDQWFRREGRYDRGPEMTQRWEREDAQVRAWFAELPFDEAEVLELASGTGIWTARYVARAASVTAIDASPEMVQLARERLGPYATKVDFILADLFAWQPVRRHDVVVTCFWLSHVPRHRLDAFLASVARAVTATGVVAFVDSRDEPTSRAVDHDIRAVDGEIEVRRLNDGRHFRVVKNHWTPAELRAAFTNAGLTADIRLTPTYFLHGTARPQPLL